MKGISGQYAGTSIELAADTLVIGRDPGVAQLVYPNSEEDISRKHCTVYFDQARRQFVLEDFSSNGTFLASGEKLAPGKPYYLDRGNHFYLVDPKEAFAVRLIKQVREALGT